MTVLLATITGPEPGQSVILSPNLAPGYVQVTQLPSAAGFRVMLGPVSPVFDSNIELLPPFRGELVARVQGLSTPWYWRQLIDRRTIMVPQPRPNDPPGIELFVTLSEGIQVQVFGD